MPCLDYVLTIAGTCGIFRHNTIFYFFEVKNVLGTSFGESIESGGDSL